MKSALSPRRLLTRVLAVPTSVALTTLAALFLLAGPASAAGSLTASQTSGLTSGQTITVTGTGFSPNAKMYVAFCDTSVPNGGACDMSHFAQATTDASGGFTTPLVVEETFSSTNCASAPCGIQTSNAANPTNAADAATLKVSFAGASAPGSTPPDSSSPAASAPPATSPAASTPAAPTSAAKAADTAHQSSSSNTALIIVIVVIVVVLLAIVLYVMRGRLGRRSS